MSASSDTKQTVPQQDNSEIALSILALAEAIKAGQTNGIDGKLAGIEKFLLERESTRPQENLFNPPLISHFNPKGERDFPRPDLKCEMLWVGYKMSKEVLRYEEIELLNELEPGVYRVTKSDGRSIPLTVTERVAENGKRERLSIHFPCKNSEDRSNHLSMESYLREVLGKVSSTENLRAQIEQLKQQLAAGIRQ